MDDVKIGIDRKTHRLKEECLARKRNQEYRKQLFWNDITNYYKSWDVQAAKYNVWTTQPTTPVRYLLIILRFHALVVHCTHDVA